MVAALSLSPVHLRYLHSLCFVDLILHLIKLVFEFLYRDARHEHLVHPEVVTCVTSATDAADGFLLASLTSHKLCQRSSLSIRPGSDENQPTLAARGLQNRTLGLHQGVEPRLCP